MPIIKKEDLLNKISELAGDDNSDTILGILEDVEDTFTDYDTRVGEDWKTKYEENDAMWRQKYRDRFYHGGNDDNDITTPNTVKQEQFEDVKEDAESITFDDLFTKREG